MDVLLPLPVRKEYKMEITPESLQITCLKVKPIQQCHSGAQKLEGKPESECAWVTFSYSDSLSTLTLWTWAASLLESKKPMMLMARSTSPDAAELLEVPLPSYQIPVLTAKKMMTYQRI